MTTTSRTRTILQIAGDFSLGLLLFALVAGAFSVSSGQAGPAFATTEPSGWLTTATAANDLGMFGREGALVLLALTCGGLSAFNLSIVRHLRMVAGASRHTPPSA